jgi:F-type H+-transporting ATPase subunit alpha
VELLKQTNYSPYPIEDQTVSIWMGTDGKVDDIPVGDVRRFEQEFLQHLRHSHKETLDAIAEGNWDDDTVETLSAAIDQFKRGFASKDYTPQVNEADAKAMAEGEEGIETVTRHVPPKAKR